MQMRIQSFVQGDVGSGKTVIAALIAAAFLGSGYQVVMMAPTQVLAKQHFDSMMYLFSPHEISVAYAATCSCNSSAVRGSL